MVLHRCSVLQPLQHSFVAENRVLHPFVDICTSMNGPAPGRDPVILRKLYVFTLPVTAVHIRFLVMNITSNVSLTAKSKRTKRKTPPAGTISPRLEIQDLSFKNVFAFVALVSCSRASQPLTHRWTKSVFHLSPMKGFAGSW